MTRTAVHARRAAGPCAAAIADRARCTGFLRERFKGTAPDRARAASSRSCCMANGIYVGVLGLDSLAAVADARRLPSRGGGRRCRPLTSS